MDVEKIHISKLDAHVAKEIMGWEFLPLPETNRYGLCRNCGRALHDDHLDRQEERGICAEEECFFSEDIAAAMQVEDRIEELGLEETYINRLIRLLGISAPYLDQLFILVHASPEDRCRAAVLAAEAE